MATVPREKFIAIQTGKPIGSEASTTDTLDVADKLTERQRVILDILRNVASNVALNTKYFAEQLNVNRKTIQRDLASLQEKQLIRWVGSKKTGHWEIVSQ